jgi:hypothetical protein
LAENLSKAKRFNSGRERQSVLQPIQDAGIAMSEAAKMQRNTQKTRDSRNREPPVFFAL